MEFYDLLYQRLKKQLETGQYSTADAIARIQFAVASFELEIEQATELIAIARERGLGDNYGERIAELEARVSAIEARLASEDEAATAYPDWVQPTGAHDAYKAGDIVRYKGKLYKSTNNGNVWPPDVTGWTEYKEG